jgi:hypothetical protein
MKYQVGLVKCGVGMGAYVQVSDKSNDNKKIMYEYIFIRLAFPNFLRDKHRVNAVCLQAFGSLAEQNYFLHKALSYPSLLQEIQHTQAYSINLECMLNAVEL